MNKNYYKKIYIMLTAISMLLFLVVMFFTRGEGFNRYFWSDTLDTGMDFFNSIIYTKGRKPYTQYNTIYPPLANAFFWLIIHCMPLSIVESMPNDFAGSVAIRGSSIDLRVEQISFFAYMMFIVIVTILFIVVMSYAYENVRLGIGVGIALLFSSGSLFSFERGNIIILSAVFLIAFFVFYDSPSKLHRELAFICLAFSAGLKLYPALFGLVLVFQKRWKESFRTIIYGMFFFFVPFVLFEGKYGMIGLFNSLTRFAAKDTVRIGYGYNADAIVSSVAYQFSTMFSLDYEVVSIQIMPLIKCIKIGVVLFMLFYIFIKKENWKKILGIAIVVLFVQNSIDYTLIFLLPVLIEMMKKEEYDKGTKIYFGLLCAILLPLPILGMSENTYINHIMALRQYAIILLLATMFVDVLLSIKSKKENIDSVAC